jgi:hypothetical protein
LRNMPVPIVIPTTIAIPWVSVRSRRKSVMAGEDSR